MSAPNGAPFRIQVTAPGGVPEQVVQVTATQVLHELDLWFPLMPPQMKQDVIQGILNDLPKIAEYVNGVLADQKNQGATWGLMVGKRSPILAPGVVDHQMRDATGFAVSVRLSDAKSPGQLLQWLGVYSLVAYPSLRALLAVSGFQLGFQRNVPIPSESDSDKT